MPGAVRPHHLVIVVVLSVIGIAAAALALVVDRSEGGSANAATSPTDPSDSAASTCAPVLRTPVGGAGAHIDGAPISYSAAPPAFGDHRSRWEVRAASFYGVADRPDVAVLVHNLEHGYNILWYDQSVVDDDEAVQRLREIANAYASLRGERDPATAFIAAPWTTDDGDSFPAGMDYAFTHWYADPTDRSRSRQDEVGLTQYCSDISADIVRQWMLDYPLTDAPEGYPDLM